MSSLNSNLRNDILKTIVYFEIFEYPLTVEQIFSFLPQKAVSVAEILLVVDTLVLQGKLSREKQYYFLPPNDKRIVEK